VTGITCCCFFVVDINYNKKANNPTYRTFSYIYFVPVIFITSDKGGGKCVCPRLSVCLLARLLKNACMDLDEMLRVV